MATLDSLAHLQLSTVSSNEVAVSISIDNDVQKAAFDRFERHTIGCSIATTTLGLASFIGGALVVYNHPCIGVPLVVGGILIPTIVAYVVKKIIKQRAPVDLP